MTSLGRNSFIMSQVLISVKSKSRQSFLRFQEIHYSFLRNLGETLHFKLACRFSENSY